MAGDHRAHRVAQAMRVEPAAQRDIELHRIHVVAALCGARVKQQALLQGGQRQHVSDAVFPAQLVDLLLAQALRHDIGGRQPAAAGSHERADAGQRVFEPEPAQSG